MSVIKIKNLKLNTIIGIHDLEKEVTQSIILNIHIDYNAELAALSDDLKDTVDYQDIESKVKSFVEGTQFLLLEKMGKGIIDLIMKNLLVLKTKIEIDKPNALAYSESVSIIMESN